MGVYEVCIKLCFDFESFMIGLSCFVYDRVLDDWLYKEIGLGVF